MMIKETTEIRERLIHAHQITDRLIFLFGLCIGSPDYGTNAGINADIILRTPMRNSASFDLRIKCLAVLDGARIGEHGVRVFARKSDTRLGSTGLKDDRLALRGALDIKRPFNREKAPLMVEPMEPFRLVKLPALTITNEGIFIP